MVTGAVEGAVSGAVSHRVSTGSWSGAGQAALEGMADGALEGAITGAIQGGMSSPYCFIAGTEVLTDSGQIPIERIRAGDILVTVNGDYVVVEKIQHELLENPIFVYNFEVEDFHTYYVSAINILSHNACRNPGGRHGGSAHRAKIEDVKNSLIDKGWEVAKKVSRVMVGNRKYRYPDITAIKDGITRYYQIGRTTLSGKPVARELRALRDLAQTGAKVFFVPYI